MPTSESHGQGYLTVQILQNRHHFIKTCVVVSAVWTLKGLSHWHLGWRGWCLCTAASPRKGAGLWSLAPTQNQAWGGRTPRLPPWCPAVPAAARLPALPWKKITVLPQLTVLSGQHNCREVLNHLFLQKASRAEVSPLAGAVTAVI